MSASDDDLEDLLRRTRASRDRLNARLAALGEPTTPMRSPLREKNVTVNVEITRDRSPLKSTSSTRMSSPSKTPSSTRLSSMSTTPTKTYTTTTMTSKFPSSPSRSSLTPSKSSLLTGSNSTLTPGSRREEETYNREVTETTTTIVGEPRRSPKGTKETYTKTTITETEEKIEKKEVYKFTEVRKGGRSTSPRRSVSEDTSRIETPARRFFETSSMETPVPANKRVIESKTVTFKNSPIVRTVFRQDDEDDEDEDTEDGTSSAEDTTATATKASPTLGSPSRFGSCRDMSLSRSRSCSPTKTPEPLSTSRPTTPSRARTPSPSKYNSSSNVDKDASTAETKSTEKKKKYVIDDNQDYDWDLESARKKRLAALATKFKVYDDGEDESAVKNRSSSITLAAAAASSSPSRRDRTKVVDVDKEISKTKNLASDAGFISSLKAQGFEETQSKTKLVYDFGKRGRSESPSKRESPAPRSQSPYKMNPHQFIAPQKSSAASSPATKTPIPAATYRSNSPTRMVSSPARPTSPFKIHPLQFVSPQKAAEAAAIAKEAEGPPKPARTFAAAPVAKADPPETAPKTWRTEKTVTVTPVRAPSPVRSASPAKTAPQRPLDAEALTDTASRRSILEKRNLFDSASPSAGSRTPDPAMLPMSERRKLFEKNLTVPKPIARFGESVTPAMLSKAQVETPNVRPPPKTTMTEPAWKRRREASPEHTFATPKPAERRSPPKSAAVVSQPRGEDPTTKRFDNSRRLFENLRPEANWRDNEIARKQEAAREKDMQVLLNRFNKPIEKSSNLESDETDATEDEEMAPVTSSPPKNNYPGVNSLKKIKVSPPKPGQLYPDLESIYDERPDTAMSGESAAPSEAPSLGSSIRRVASANRREEHNRMTTISEDVDSEDDCNEELEFSTMGNQINDMLDEALDDSDNMSDGEGGPTPPKMTRRRTSTSPTRRASSPSGTSAGSWEYENRRGHEYKGSPSARYGGSPSARHGGSPSAKYGGASPSRYGNSPKAPLPLVDTENGPAPVEDLMHTVSFYRKTKPMVTQATPVRKIVRLAAESSSSDENKEDEAAASKAFNERIKKLQEDIAEQMQRRLQTSKALDICQSKNEFEGSCERVEFERLLLEAHHKYSASTAEINRLKSEGAKGILLRRTASGRMSKGTLTISGLALQLKPEFVRMISSAEGIYEDVHYFVCLVKYRSQVIASQMLSTLDGISRGGKLIFTNLININDLDFDFRIYLEVYGLQTPREHLSHEAKYHIRKEKSMFNLTPLKKLKKQESRFVSSRHENPVNNLTIRKPKFGLVGYTTITIETLKVRSGFRLEKVPMKSPLEGGLEMKLNVHSESRIEESGFLTMFTEINGLGNWSRRWCRLKDNTLFFWKYPEEEEKKLPPCFQISLHNCITDNITLAPRDVCSRMNTFMLENQRPIQPDDQEGQILHLDHKRNVAIVRHLLMADTRDDRLNWCNTLNKSLETLRAWDPTSARPRSGSQSSSCAASDEDTVSNGSTVIW